MAFILSLCFLSMLIPQNFLDLINQGCAFSLVVIGPDRAKHSYSRSRSRPQVLNKETTAQMSIEGEGALGDAFREAQVMSDEERERQGIRLSRCNKRLVVRVKSKFAKTFECKNYASETSTQYIGRDTGSQRCFVILRPDDKNVTLALPTPTETSQDPPSWSDLPPFAPERNIDQEALDLAAKTLANARQTDKPTQALAHPSD